MRVAPAARVKRVALDGQPVRTVARVPSDRDKCVANDASAMQGAREPMKIRFVAKDVALIAHIRLCTSRVNRIVGPYDGHKNGRQSSRLG